ncbi:MAG: hypothetical protein WCS37_17060 [Chloroflexota bacterium]|nr:hypothetical protein [Chloroflexota bacterium]
MSNFLVVTGYEVGWILFLAGLTQRLERNRDLAREFEGLYFLKWSAGLAFIVQVGFTVLVSFLFAKQESLAVSLTALVAIPGWLLFSGWLQWSFFQRYKRLPNIIKRLERMNSNEQAALLRSLPPKIFNQLPGDYRFISRSSEPGSQS